MFLNRSFCLASERQSACRQRRNSGHRTSKSTCSSIILIDSAFWQIIGKRLEAELENNPSLKVIWSKVSFFHFCSPQIEKIGDMYEVKARGELQLAILIESMRREGFEVCVWHHFSTLSTLARHSCRCRRPPSFSATIWSRLRKCKLIVCLASVRFAVSPSVICRRSR